MIASRSMVLIPLLTLLAACGGSSDPTAPPPPPPTYQSIAGSYAGPISGLTQGIALNAVASLTIAQTAGTTSGSWALTGTLNDGVSFVNVAGAGSMTGTVASGNNPSVTLIFSTPACPNYRANFSGSYDTANHRLTVSGPIEFFAAGTCTVALSYQEILILQ